MIDKHFPQMSSGPEDAAVWLPQDPAHQGYSVPPDVIPHHQDSKDYWSTMPAQLSKRRSSLKHKSIGSTDSGVSLGSNHKEHIELTKTVKHSLTVTGICVFKCRFIYSIVAIACCEKESIFFSGRQIYFCTFVNFLDS